MSNVAEFEKAYKELSPPDREAVRAWIEEYEADLVDQALEQAVLNGKFDKLAQEAREDYRAGRTMPL